MNLFDSIKQISPKGNEIWYARQLQDILEYKDWRNFINVIDKAKEACINSGNDIHMNFADVTYLVDAGFTKKPVDDIVLSRYACYLILQNSDPKKDIIALGQTYFAQQTRKIYGFWLSIKLRQIGRAHV